MSLQNNETKTGVAEEESFDIKSFASKLLNNWYWFVIGVAVCGSLAFLYGNYATPTYKVNSEIMVDDQGSSLPGGKSMSSSSTMDFSDLLGLPSNAYNEMDILRSRNLMTNVVKALNLNITIFRSEKLRSVELFDEAPFTVKVIETQDSILLRKFDVDITGNSVHISNSKENLDTTVNVGSLIKCKRFNLFIDKKPGVTDAKGYKVAVQSVDSKVESLSKNLTIDLTDKKSTTMGLTLEYPNSKKGEAILGALMNLYLQYNLEKKKQIADSTLTFIDGRLGVVSKDLSGVETKLTEFKEENKISDVDEQAKVLVGNVSEYYKKINDLEVQLTVLNDLSTFINNPNNKRILPNSLAVQDPVFAAALGTYNQLLIQRGQLTLSYKENNPVVQNLDNEIEINRQGLLKSFNTYKNSLEVSINSVKKQNSTLNATVQRAPKKERIFLDYSREQNLKQELYLYLLQKREETAISKTSTISNARIIDPAKSDYEPYKPNKLLIMIIGMTLGLILPWSLITLRELLNIKILNKEDIIKHTNVTVLGEIGNNTEGSSLVVANNQRGIISEQFRALRTNLQFVLDNEKSSVIMITSSMSGEGKSFITLNLASVLALSGKKVIMLELDLRKPKLSTNIGMDHNFGFTNYVISASMTEAEIIRPAFFSENLFAISAGPIPPNPSELLLSNRFKTLLEYLKKNYDYILIDSAPIGLVSDAQVIAKHADLTLYVARQNYTYKTQLNFLNGLVAEQKLQNTYLVINDIKQRKGGYYGYGYGYGYGGGYGHGYGNDDSSHK
jgi:tyrosine-protein kinase Etk/Wzc